MEYDPASPTDEPEDYNAHMDLSSIPLPENLTEVSPSPVGLVKTVVATTECINDIPLPVDVLASDIPLPPSVLDSKPQVTEPSPPALPASSEPSVNNGSDVGPLKFSLRIQSKPLTSDSTVDSASVFESSKETKREESRVLPKLQAMMKRSKPSQLPTGVLPSKAKLPVAETKTELFLPTKESDVNGVQLSEPQKFSVPNSLPNLAFLNAQASLLDTHTVNVNGTLIEASDSVSTGPLDSNRAVSLPTSVNSNTNTHIPNLMSLTVQPLQSLMQTASTHSTDPSALLRQTKMSLANMQYVNPQKLRSAQMIAMPLIANPAIAAQPHHDDQSKSRRRSRSRSSRRSHSGRRSSASRRSRRRHSYSSSDSSPRRRSPRRYQRRSRSRRSSPDHYSRGRRYSRNWDRGRRDYDRRRDHVTDSEPRRRRDDRSDRGQSSRGSRDRVSRRRSTSYDRSGRSKYSRRSPDRSERVTREDSRKKSSADAHRKRHTTPTKKSERSHVESSTKRSRKSESSEAKSQDKQIAERRRRSRTSSSESSSDSSVSSHDSLPKPKENPPSKHKEPSKQEADSDENSDSSSENSSSSSSDSEASEVSSTEETSAIVTSMGNDKPVTPVPSPTKADLDVVTNASPTIHVDSLHSTHVFDTNGEFCNTDIADDQDSAPSKSPLAYATCDEPRDSVPSSEVFMCDTQRLLNLTPNQTPSDSLGGDASAGSSVSSLHSAVGKEATPASEVHGDAKYHLRQRKAKPTNVMHEQLQALLCAMRPCISPPKSPSRYFDTFPEAPRPQYIHILSNDYSHVEDESPEIPQTTLSALPSLLGSSAGQTRKDMRHWVCDCVVPSVDELRSGMYACGPGCINRALNIECGPTCPAGRFCSNRQFQDKLYAPVEPFYAGPNVGWGLRTSAAVQSNCFVIEYVGEVIDFVEFRRRIRRYERVGHQHHYFMALESDRFIDAGTKGNWARFVNHSCEPNCVTQKWSVDGKIRIGFFTLKDIPAGTELTIDYQFAQFGASEQKCYCGAPSCSGIMGSTNKSLQDKVRLKDTTMVERRVMQLLELKSFEHADNITLLLQVMVQECLTRYTRVELLRRLSVTDSAACLKLFRQYNGLDMLAALMCDSESTDWELKRLILVCLDKIPVSEQKQLQSNSRLFEIVTQWSSDPRYCRPRIPQTPSDTSSQTVKQDGEVNSNAVEHVNSLDHDQNSTLNDLSSTTTTCDISPCDLTEPHPPGEVDTESQAAEMEKICILAKKLTEKWSKLPLENYRIPRIERQETEKELHVVNHTNSSLVSWGHTDKEDSAFASWTNTQQVQSRRRPRPNRRRDHGSCDTQSANTSSNPLHLLTKSERRKLFEERMQAAESQGGIEGPTEDGEEPMDVVDTDEDQPTDHARMADFENVRHLLLLLLINELNISGVSLDQLALPGLDSKTAAKSLHDVLQALPGMLSNFLPIKDLSLITPLIDRLCTELIAHTAKPSSPLPPGWQSARDPGGKLYYYNMDAKVVQREHPGQNDGSTGSRENPAINSVERTRAEKAFTAEVGNFVLRLLKPYRLPNCLTGRIESSTDMAHIARKLTHAFASKALKQLPSTELPVLTSSLQEHIRTSLTRYMTTRGAVYKRHR